MEAKDARIAELERANNALKFRADRYKADFKMEIRKRERLKSEILKAKQLTGDNVYSKNIQLMARIQMLEDNINRYRGTLNDTRQFDSIINDGNLKVYVNKIKHIEYESFKTT